MRLAETRSLIKAAERGDLQDQAWDDVRRHPLLWEIRLRWPGNILVRGYFHEPDLRSDRTVLAKVHVKVIVRGDLQATRARQNLAIEEAGRRIDFGRAWWWGLDATDPLWGQPSA